MTAEPETDPDLERIKAMSHEEWVSFNLDQSPTRSALLGNQHINGWSQECAIIEPNLTPIEAASVALQAFKLTNTEDYSVELFDKHIVISGNERSFGILHNRDGRINDGSLSEALMYIIDNITPGVTEAFHVQGLIDTR